MDEADTARELKMMESREDWPRWPLLPIKRRVEGESGIQIATLYASDPLEFFEVSMYGLQDAIKGGMKGTQVTPLQLVNGGWVVD